MDARISSDGVKLLDSDALTMEEAEFIAHLFRKGGYWELRKYGHSYTLHDKDNEKYKGSLNEIMNEISQG